MKRNQSKTTNADICCDDKNGSSFHHDNRNDSTRWNWKQFILILSPLIIRFLVVILPISITVWLCWYDINTSIGSIRYYSSPSIITTTKKEGDSAITNNSNNNTRINESILDTTTIFSIGGNDNDDSNNKVLLPLCTRDEIRDGSWVPVTYDQAPYISKTKHLRCPNFNRHRTIHMNGILGIP